MASATDAQDALYDAIVKAAAEVMSTPASVSVRSAALRDVALAFRYAAGGSQPGGGSPGV